ncbi:X-linked interleukin-1 receptor accessory protein-like 2 [Etheostoma cragini]|uniref:X-linked interleukin-1 receptor accessory protein-like 2 n=1 Tax=Etheostoma cragini TaxID=417921 RepID=UPI00155E9B75|nr:X-linked interleukin-1 receptor accessory protein-like 2 [Etheostoma cragini]
MCFLLIMTVKILLILLTLASGGCPLRPREIFVKDGEMVVLYCPRYRGYDGKLIWTSYTTQVMDLTNNVSSAEQRQIAMLIHERSLVILSASVNHQGNYSCTQRNASTWFRLTVVTTQSRDYKERFQYPATCSTNEAFTLHCPDVNIPAGNIPNITSNGIIWHKEGESLPTDSYFSSVEEKDGGVYTCTRSYLCYGQICNMTFTVVLNVQQKDKSGQSVIVSPSESGVFHVDLGSTKVIDCKAVMYSDFDEVFWLSGKSLVETDNSLPVFSNSTRENNDGEIKMTASLVFKKVSEEDLLKNYTCNLESVFGHSSFVTINLAQKLSFSSLYLTFCILCVVVVTVVAVAVYLKLKMDTSDGKSHDAFLICYKSSTDAGLHENDRKGQENVLEENFGYSLCLDRNV